MRVEVILVHATKNRYYRRFERQHRWKCVMWFVCVCVCACARVCVCVHAFGHVQLFATPWTIAHQALLSKGFSRQDYWSGLPCTPPGDLPNPGIKPESPAIPILLADSLLLSHQGSSKGQCCCC